MNSPPTLKDLDGVARRLVNVLLDLVAAARSRRRAATLYDFQAELSDMRDVDDWCPADDMTGIRVISAVARLLAETRSISTAAALTYLRQVVLCKAQASKATAEPDDDLDDALSPFEELK
jgi:hypothetical protein